ncbi:MerR family transcriptional regulator [Humibacillus sp. DSM 29435]|uniref:MerR family transcriptional regulator n=1 Tax=Humibacillus sp. DSM 29435 TaxID=1869167 RepID=UPI00158683D5|nr:MerR family transcriptional regulator [Humibacillus sp. DSM 29435]
MRVSELAVRSDVTIASVKYYIRIGLLHPGVAQSATRAEYDDSHLERVRLIRTLVDVGGLSIERISEVVAALDNPPASRHELLGTAHEVLRDRDRPPASASAQRLVDGVVPACLPSAADHGNPGRSPATLTLDQAITVAESSGWPITAETLTCWGEAMRAVAEVDVVADLADASPAQALRYAIIGNVVTDPILLALRRVAQERLSSERLGGVTAPP